MNAAAALLAVTLTGTAVQGTGPTVAGLPKTRELTSAELRQMKVESVLRPLAIDVLAPTFSWEIQHPDRGIVQSGFTLTVWKRGNSENAAKHTQEASNRSTFVPLPAGLTLESDSDYDWSVALPGLGLRGNSSFSTGLLAPSDWDRSAWLVASSAATIPSGCNGCAAAAQLRKRFSLPAGDVTRARLFVAVPGMGRVRLNGAAVDGIVGTRSRSQYNLRTLYSTYDVAHLLRAGAANALAISVAGGWYAIYGYGPATMRCVLRATVGGKAFELGSDGSWRENAGPIEYASVYVGVSHDARLET